MSDRALFIAALFTVSALLLQGRPLAYRLALFAASVWLCVAIVGVQP